jgi:hypothetical protein
MDGIEAHSTILHAHFALRRKIAALDPLLRRELETPGKGARGLRAKVRDLAETLHAHIDAEEKMLAPILHELDAWGPARVERMLRDHVAQRRAIAELLLLANRRRLDGATLARVTCEFVDDLLADMEHEESDLLPPLLDDGEVIVARQHAE